MKLHIYKMSCPYLSTLMDKINVYTLLDVTVQCFCFASPGVVRGIDVERGLYYLLTPVDPSILRKVNCLLLGAISLPSSILTTQVRP